MIKLIVGIDPGVNTGIALWDYENRKLVDLFTLKIHRAMEFVLQLKNSTSSYGDTSLDLIIFEDARSVKYQHSAAKAQGAGSIKRDCTIWEDFFKDYKFPYLRSLPNKTKIDREVFEKMTGWKKPSNNHGRDAAMIVYGLSDKQVQIKKMRQEHIEKVRFPDIGGYMKQRAATKETLRRIVTKKAKTIKPYQKKIK